jgi:hypothetical protein
MKLILVLLLVFGLAVAKPAYETLDQEFFQDLGKQSYPY